MNVILVLILESLYPLLCAEIELIILDEYGLQESNLDHLVIDALISCYQTILKVQAVG